MSPISSIETNLDNLSAANIKLYSNAIASLDEAIVSFRQLPDYVRKATETRFWTRFRQGMHGAELNRRTLLGKQISANRLSNPPKLPKVKASGRRKARPIVPVQVHESTLLSALNRAARSHPHPDKSNNR